MSNNTKKSRTHTTKAPSHRVNPVPHKRVNEARLRMWQRLAIISGAVILICLVALIIMGEL